MSVLLLDVFVTVASGWYGSIVGYACFGRRPPIPVATAAAAAAGNLPNNNSSRSEILSIGAGWLVGSLTGAAGLSLANIYARESLQANSTFILFVASGANLWLVFLGCCWLLRDRHRPSPYNTLGQLYLEMVADGMLVLNLPVTSVMFGVAALAGKAIVSWISSFFI